MADKLNNRWLEYYEISKNKPPSDLLVRAIKFVNAKNTALDLGAGALRDTKFLLTLGFKVTSVDSEPQMAKVANELENPNLKAITSSFDNFSYIPETYNLVNAQWSLPFNPPNTFNETWNKIKASLKSGGIFTGQFFGDHDEWNIPGKNMTFHTKTQVQELLSDMDILELKEENENGKTANGTPKHWHVFHVIAGKK